MKSKSPSAASKKSTPKGHFFPRWFHRSADDQYCGKRPCAAILLALLLPLAACQHASNQPPPLVLEMRAEQTFELKIQTPTPAWSLKVTAVYATATEFIAISQLTRSEGMFAQVISTAQTSLTVTEPGGPRAIRHYVLGKTWNWTGPEDVTYIDSLDQIKDALADARSVPFTTP